MTIASANRLIESLSQLLRASLPKGAGAVEEAQVERLLDIYYRYISPVDLEEYDPHDLVGALISHWRLMQDRRPDEAKIKVYNPSQEEHGWYSKDTIVEVVARDMPFLVDSISALLNRRGLTIRLTFHPVFAVNRDGSGRLTAIHEAISGVDGVTTEAVIQLHVDRQPDDSLAEIQTRVEGVINDVTLATSDWLRMRSLAEKVHAELGAGQQRTSSEAVQEAQAFVHWMIHDHFLFIAACCFDLDASNTGDGLRFVNGSGLGILRDGDEARSRAARWISGLGRGLSNGSGDLIVTKANARSSVHRPAYMDCITVNRRDEEDHVVGFYCFIGLFSSGAYSTPPHQIPLLRRKVEAVFADAQISPRSHSGRVVVNILDNFPRDALFQISSEDLLATTLGVLGLQERQRTRLFVIPEPFRRFFSCLVYLPREHYSREVRLAVQKILVDALGGTDVEFETQFSESILARIHFVIRIPVDSEPVYDTEALEARIVEVATTWQDGLRAALSDQVDERLAAQFFETYAQAFPSGYREDFHPRIAVHDIQRIEALRKTGRLGVHLYHPIAEKADQMHVRLYSTGQAVSLSQVIPVLEHLGLNVLGERPYRLRHPSGDFWIHDFATARVAAGEAISNRVREQFVETFLRVWEGAIDSDGFNALVLRAELTWKEAMMFRAYSRYMHQIKVPHTQAYSIATLNRHPQIVQILNRLFHLSFNPEQQHRKADCEAVITEFEAELEMVASLDEDRILRRFLNLIQATLRTNFFCTAITGGDAPYLSLKINPGAVADMPLPRPMFEIFVYSTRMEGVHLRGGRVARGGLRWSDRMDDYRTEILGLMKAQMVKNTVIVPVGSKGGFIVKNIEETDHREQAMGKVVACYQTLLRGMLDVTDNLVGDAVVPPADVVRRDDDDPYLVIAADKGTASFSDIANEVSKDYGFWLGDAFASGGSAGYDHKAMGITARGAWESVKRNFRELGLDTQAEDFTVVGIGDMSGDVFGNGMLLSRHIRLVGAFNHKHIFLDPDPNAEVSYRERERLFGLPRSGWSDYDRSLISTGGGVYARDAKSIVVTPEVAGLLGLRVERITPNEMISAMLRAPVDLLWNGGIGTYVKASYESDEQARDKANDAVRIDASELNCRVVGEGGNLGLTQLARTEFALNGGSIYTDAIDNSAGVDCSDHEVNIKILLDKIVADGDMTGKQRNKLLVDMTDDVARLVLADNYAQTQAISFVVAGGTQRLYEQARFIDLLEHNGGFDRRLEGLPDKKGITERLAMERGLTKPEVAVLLAYSKMNYFEAIVASDVPDDPFVQDRLIEYFPPVLGERFPRGIKEHRLRREIIATTIAGHIADHVGPGVGFRVREEVGCEIADIARAYLVVTAIFKTDRLWQRVEALDNRVAAGVQIDMMSAIAEFLEETFTGVLRSYRTCLDIGGLTGRFAPGIAELWDAMPRPLAAQDKADFERRARRLAGQGVPLDLSREIAGLIPMAASLDVVDVASATGTDIAGAAWIHSALNHSLELEWIQRRIAELPVQTHWHLLAQTKLQATLNRYRHDLTAQVLRSRDKERSPRGMLERWTHGNRTMLDRHARMIAEFKANNVFDFAILSLVIAGVGELLPAKTATEKS